mgnify:CR=1 FL=1
MLDKYTNSNPTRDGSIIANISKKFEETSLMSQQKPATCMKLIFSFILKETCFNKKAIMATKGIVNGKKLITLNT